jgi:hypothetical protein
VWVLVLGMVRQGWSFLSWAADLRPQSAGMPMSPPLNDHHVSSVSQPKHKSMPCPFWLRVYTRDGRKKREWNRISSPKNLAEFPICFDPPHKRRWSSTTSIVTAYSFHFETQTLANFNLLQFFFCTTLYQVWVPQPLISTRTNSCQRIGNDNESAVYHHSDCHT